MVFLSQGLVSGGALEVLVAHLDHEDPVVMANSLWALMVSLSRCMDNQNLMVGVA